jgi:hypothetical protein
MTLAVAAYTGRVVPAEHELAELARLRAELATAQQQIAAVLAIPRRTDEELEQMDPEDYHQAVGHDSAVYKVQSLLRAPAVAE